MSKSKENNNILNVNTANTCILVDLYSGDLEQTHTLILALTHTLTWQCSLL